MTFSTLENDIESLEMNGGIITSGIILESKFSLAPLWLLAI